MWIKISLVLIFLGFALSRPKASNVNPELTNFDFAARHFENGYVTMLQRIIRENLYKWKNKFVDVGEGGQIVRRYVRM